MRILFVSCLVATVMAQGAGQAPGKTSGGSQAICIFFPPAVVRIPVDKSLPECQVPGSEEYETRERALGGWRRDVGTLGNCGDQCCEWDPPISKKIQKGAPPTWFKTTSSDCNSPANVINGPFIIKGQAGQRVNICYEKDGSYVFDQGQ